MFFKIYFKFCTNLPQKDNFQQDLTHLAVHLLFIFFSMIILSR